MLKSRKFTLVLLGLAIFTVGIYTTDYSPIELATGVSIVIGIYFGVNLTQKIKAQK